MWNVEEHRQRDKSTEILLVGRRPLLGRKWSGGDDQDQSMTGKPAAAIAACCRMTSLDHYCVLVVERTVKSSLCVPRKRLKGHCFQGAREHRRADAVASRFFRKERSAPGGTKLACIVGLAGNLVYWLPKSVTRWMGSAIHPMVG